jgi:hypothetical protein
MGGMLFLHGTVLQGPEDTMPRGTAGRTLWNMHAVLHALEGAGGAARGGVNG